MSVPIVVQFTYLITGESIRTVQSARDVKFTVANWLDTSSCEFTCDINDIPDYKLNAFYMSYGAVGYYLYGARICDVDNNVLWYGAIDKVEIDNSRTSLHITCKPLTAFIETAPIIANDYPDGATIRVNEEGTAGAITRPFSFTGATVRDLVSALSTRYADYPNLFGRYQAGNIKYEGNFLDLKTVGEAITEVRERYPNKILRLSYTLADDKTLAYWDDVQYERVKLFENDVRIMSITDISFKAGRPAGVVSSFQSAVNHSYAFYYTYMPNKSNYLALRAPTTYKSASAPQSVASFKQVAEYLSDTGVGATYKMRLVLDDNTLNLLSRVAVCAVVIAFGDGELLLTGLVESFTVDTSADSVDVTVKGVNVSNTYDDDTIVPLINLVDDKVGAAVLRNTRNVSLLSAPNR